MTPERYRDQMHRAYRVARAKVALTTSPWTPEYGELLRAEFAATVHRLALDNEEVAA